MTPTEKAARSAGARLERKAMRAKVRRVLAAKPNDVTAQELLAYVLTRQSRYDKKPGGLGKR